MDVIYFRIFVYLFTYFFSFYRGLGRAVGLAFLGYLHLYFQYEGTICVYNVESSIYAPANQLSYVSY